MREKHCIYYIYTYDNLSVTIVVVFIHNDLIIKHEHNLFKDLLTQLQTQSTVLYKYKHDTNMKTNTNIFVCIYNIIYV